MNKTSSKHQRVWAELSLDKEQCKLQCGKEPKPLKEKFLSDLVRDETKFKREVGIYGEPMEELIPIQVHLTDPIKTTRIRAMLPRDT